MSDTTRPSMRSTSGVSGETSNAANGSSTAVPKRRRETTWEKAFRLLTEGKVQVTFVSDGRYLICAHVEGDSSSYLVDFGVTREQRWTCSCPARADCSHMRAVQQVTAARGME